MAGSRQYCETYRGWHIWFEPDGGYVVGQDKARPFDAEGYYGSRDDAKRDVDWLVSQPVETPDDTPSLDLPWWAHR